MSDSDPNTSEWDGTPLVLGATLSIEPREDGVHVEIVVADEETVETAKSEEWDAETLCNEKSPGTWDVLFQKNVERTFYKTQKYREIANTLDERCPDHLDAPHLAAAFRSFCETLEANESEIQETLQSPTVTQLIDETEAVEYRRVGDDSAVTIRLKHDGQEAVIDFTPEEWLNSTGGEIEVRYFGAFFEEITIEQEDWDRLKNAWTEQAVYAGGDDTGEWDAIAEQVLGKLKDRLNIYNGREALQGSDYTAWYEAQPATRLRNLNGETGPVVWVCSLALIDLLGDTSKTHADLGEFVNHCEEIGTIEIGKKRIDDVTAYGFSPDTAALNVNTEQVMDWEDDEDDDPGHGVEP